MNSFNVVLKVNFLSELSNSISQYSDGKISILSFGDSLNRYSFITPYLVIGDWKLLIFRA